MSSRCVPVSCNRDCGAGCPLIAEVDGGRVVRISDNPLRAPYARGCIRGYQMHRVTHSPERITAPLRRVGPRGSGEFREIGWDEALRWCAEELARIRDSHGPESVLHLGGSGSCRAALHNTSSLTARFLRLYGGCTATTGSYSSAAASFVRGVIFGRSDVGVDPLTLLDSRLVILWGANVSDTRFGAQLEGVLRDRRRAGIDIVVIDPRRSRTVERLATRWVALRPGTDSALMAALLCELNRGGNVDAAACEGYTTGMEDLLRYVRGEEDGVLRDAAWASGICGTPREQILSLAQLYATVRPAALIPGLSIQRTLGGEEPCRFAVALQIATGNAGIAGGSSGGHTWGGLPIPRCGSMAVPPRGKIAHVPVYQWPDAVLGGEAEGWPATIRGIYNVGGNYVAQGSDVGKNLRAMEEVDFAVCHDVFLTPTARHCDLVLPATTFLEREDIVFPDSNYLFYSQKAVDPVGQSRSDYDIFSELADLLGFGEEYTEGRGAREWLDHFLACSDVADVDAFRDTGIYDGSDHRRIGLVDFFTAPTACPLPTPSGRIEIASDACARADLSFHPECRVASEPAGFPLRMITPHARFQVNSQHANIPWFAMRQPRSLVMHPEDAAARCVEQGSVVEVESPQGRMRIRVDLTGEIMRGVVCLPVGGWPRIDDSGTETQGAANILTSTQPTLPSNGARTHTVFVEVSAAGTEAGG